MYCPLPTARHAFKLTAIALIGVVFGCASNPDKLDAAYVSPLKYKDYDCDQIALEMDHVSNRTTKLYHRLKKERKADNWQMGVGLVLFWPTLFFLEGGDGPEASEYTQLKGEFEALRINSVQKKCEIDALSPEEVLKREDAKDKEESAKNGGDETEETDESQDAAETQEADVGDEPNEADEMGEDQDEEESPSTSEDDENDI